MTLIISTIFCISFVTFTILIFKRKPSGPYKYTVTEQFNATSEHLWNVITDYENQPLWRNGLIKSEKIINSKGSDIWKETDVKGQEIEWESFTEVRNRKVVRKTLNQDMSVISTHTYEIKPFGEISLLTATEVTDVNNVLLGWIKHIFVGATSELRQYIKDLKTKINHDIVHGANNI
tara:strand:- start:1611 stop:2141 length:531 start_codon:yes stop_codon:yes gene_type:complete